MIVFIYNNTKIVCRWCSKRHISGPKIAQIPHFTYNSLEAPQRLCKPYINVFKHKTRSFVLLFSYSDINIVCIECPNTSVLGQEKYPKMQFFINNRSQTAHIFKKFPELYKECQYPFLSNYIIKWKFMLYYTNIPYGIGEIYLLKLGQIVHFEQYLKHNAWTLCLIALYWAEIIT